jgi:hypothetical protein
METAEALRDVYGAMETIRGQVSPRHPRPFAKRALSSPRARLTVMKSAAMLSFTVVVILQISNTPPVFALPALQDSPIRKVKNDAGVGARLQPTPEHPGKSAYIRLQHIRQEPFLCVTTSATMVLAHDGVKTSPRELKALSDGRAYHPDQPFHYNKFTYFYQLLKGVASLGCTWRFNSFPLTEEGFRTGMAQVKAALDRGNPPLSGGGIHFGKAARSDGVSPSMMQSRIGSFRNGGTPM